MAFDWLAFLRQHRIDYVTRGPSTSRDNVNVRCPLCGDGDTGHHLGISLKGRGWHCWRNDTHAGKSRWRLIQLLLRCDEETARELAGGEAPATPLDHALGPELRQRLLGEKIRRPERLRLLPEFKPLKPGPWQAGPFVNYLMEERHYSISGVRWIAETYNLHYCQRGPFAQRIIVPYHDQWGKLLGWTGRTIRSREALRYRALGREPTETLPAAVYQPQQALLGLRQLWHVPDPKVLLVVEGPFDAMWMTLWGKTFGVHATCLFGLNISEEQVTLISSLQERFEKSFLLLDSGASLRAFRLASAGLKLSIKRLPSHVKDPAVLSPADAAALAVSCLG